MEDRCERSHDEQEREPEREWERERKQEQEQERGQLKTQMVVQWVRVREEELVELERTRAEPAVRQEVEACK